MADQTTNAERIDRATAADRLSDVATALRSDSEISVRVGNKDITLSPGETVNFRIDVVEKQRRFRGSRETIRIELDWNPE